MSRFEIDPSALLAAREQDCEMLDGERTAVGKGDALLERGASELLAVAQHVQDEVAVVHVGAGDHCFGEAGESFGFVLRGKVADEQIRTHVFDEFFDTHGTPCREWKGEGVLARRRLTPAGSTARGFRMDGPFDLRKFSQAPHGAQ